MAGSNRTRAAAPPTADTADEAAQSPEGAAEAAQTDKADTADEAAAPAVQLVAMNRDPAAWPEPHTADVHPDEVANYAATGWQPAA